MDQAKFQQTNFGDKELLQEKMDYIRSDEYFRSPEIRPVSPPQYFRQKEISSQEEEHLKSKVYDLRMNPREWMARNGHRIISGDPRIFQLQDKEFEKWINVAFDALLYEGLNVLWYEFLNPEEIEHLKAEIDGL
ncbi:hypothetical protein KFE98_14885 [bacterium SCSIO 12741]|nr:hypothetical protein KFE98_14885 [bacterium SCSIO 12741]